jgi:phage I-like protein
MSEKKTNDTDKKKASYKICFPIRFSEAGDVPKKIHVIPTGAWDHPIYGPMVITASDIAQFVQNFNDGIRKGVPITEGHEDGIHEQPAVGWFTELTAEADGLWANVDWNQRGKTALTQKEFKFFSPEFYEVYEDPETQEIKEHVLVGGALTNKPYFKELTAVVFSEPAIIKQFSDKNMSKKLEDIMKKKAEELSEDDKSFLKEQCDKMSEDDAETMSEDDKSLLKDMKAKMGGAEKKEEDKKASEPEDDGAKKASEPEEDEGEKKDMSETNAGMVKISASELQALKLKADEGAKAFAELSEQKIKAESNALIFSENNKTGKILPKNTDKVFSFMKGLTENQRKAFAEIVQSIETDVTKMRFEEVGGGQSSEDKNVVAGNIKDLADKKMSEANTNGVKMKYSDAVRQVLRENPSLTDNHDQSLKAE